MKIVKLTSEHSDKILPLFYSDKYMGVPISEAPTRPKNVDEFAKRYHRAFALTYLTNLKRYHAYAAFDENDDSCQALIGFYESIECPSWYWTHVKSKNASAIPLVLDECIKHNEATGRYKFFSLFPERYSKVYRRLAFSDYNNERYDAFDEYVVKANTKCIYTMPWQILFNRILLPNDMIVRCSFLKQEYRTEIPQAGGI